MASEKELNGDSDLDPENESEEEWRQKSKPGRVHSGPGFPVLPEVWRRVSVTGPMTSAHFQIPDVAPRPPCCPEQDLTV